MKEEGRSQKAEVRSEKPEGRNQKQGVRNERLEVRSQESGVRRKGPLFRLLTPGIFLLFLLASSFSLLTSSPASNGAASVRTVPGVFTVDTPTITIAGATADTTATPTTAAREAQINWTFGTVAGTYTTCTVQAKTSVDARDSRLRDGDHEFGEPVDLDRAGGDDFGDHFNGFFDGGARVRAVDEIYFCLLGLRHQRAGDGERDLQIGKTSVVIGP